MTRFTLHPGKHATEAEARAAMIQRRVERALANAKENGYDFSGWTLEAIATDMVSYDADMETFTTEEVVAALKALGHGS